MTSVLQSRLMNCLETIIELERHLERLELGHVLLSEFNQLRDFMDRIDQVAVNEEDVRRIEAATSHFLEELKGPLGQQAQGPDSDKVVQ
ncbi:hypothetical protein [Desulfocurvus sp. DL9XJH121]